MTRRFPSRANSLTPRAASSDFTCWLTAAWLTPSSSAARVKFSLRAAASKALSAFRGGRRRGIDTTLVKPREDTAGHGWPTTAPSYLAHEKILDHPKKLC